MAASSSATAAPLVERSTKVAIALPWIAPRSPHATLRTTSGVGRLTSTTAAASATSAADPQARAPRATQRLHRLGPLVEDRELVA